MFHFYANALSRASRNVAGGLFVVGLLLIGFGFLVYVLRDIFAIIFTAIFCIAGIGCFATGIKIFIAAGKLKKANRPPAGQYRENVKIRIEENFDL